MPLQITSVSQTQTLIYFHLKTYYASISGEISRLENTICERDSRKAKPNQNLGCKIAPPMKGIVVKLTRRDFRAWKVSEAEAGIGARTRERAFGTHVWVFELWRSFPIYVSWDSQLITKSQTTQQSYVPQQVELGEQKPGRDLEET